ncbi:hypothetical protein [Priestia taiwanensis]|uniref:Uncharacterized protein n=1 Tax=Priestia taiwanensis TaxID=1347902 RepID=A0A917ATV7_9BACI|nr:hypothetical protein [Priestia taiwanensis]MBM7363674.1 hypothetical protein [Priestia taiwanensis]GGE75019.1 hypothetical protein GCM10007140_26120 [Priestia taiwanensis]
MLSNSFRGGTLIGRKGNGWWIMNIKQYYRRHAFVQFTVACVCILGIVMLIGMGVKRKWELFIPLVVFSLFFFSTSWLNFKRGTEVKVEKIGRVTDIKSVQECILLQLPAADAHLLLLDPGGLLVGEIRSKRNYWLAWLYPRFMKELWKKHWTLHNAEGEVIAHYKRSFGKYSTLYVYNKEGVIGAYREKDTFRLARISGSLFNREQEEIAEVNIEDNLYHYRIINENGEQLVEFNRGWVPLGWSKRFREADTPVILLHSHLDEHTRYLLLGVAAYFTHRLYK